MAGAPKAQVEHPLLERAARIRAHLDAGKLDQADAEISAAVQEAQTITDLANTDRTVVEAVLGAYRERGKGLGAHDVLKQPEHLQRGMRVAFVRDHMKALLASQPAPTPPPAVAPAPAPAPAPAAPGPGPLPPRPGPVRVAPAGAAAPTGPTRIPDALKAKVHPRAIQVIETVIDLLAATTDEAALKTYLENKKISFGKDDAAKATTIKNLARALKTIEIHKPPLLQDLASVTEAVRVENRATRMMEIFEQCYVNIVFRQLLTGTKRGERQKGREMIEIIAQKDEAKALIEIVQAIKRSGKEGGVAQLREKLFGSQDITKTSDALRADSALRIILEEAKGKGLAPHRIIQNLDKAEGAQLATNTDELHAKVKAVLERAKKIIEEVKRTNGPRPAPRAATPQPASTPARPREATEEERQALQEVEEKLGSELDPKAKAEEVIEAINARGNSWVNNAETRMWIERAKRAKRLALRAMAATAGPSTAPTPAPRRAARAAPLDRVPETLQPLFDQLVGKIKAVRANPALLATAKQMTKSLFVQAIFVRGKNVMEALIEAHRGPFTTEGQIQKDLEHHLRTLDRLLRGEIVVTAPTPTPGAGPAGAATPAPAAPPVAPAGARPAGPGPRPAPGSPVAPRPRPPAGAPAAGTSPAAAPKLRTDLNVIDDANLRAAIEAANLSPEDLNLVLLTLELWQENANDSPLLRAFQVKVKNRVADCMRFSENKNAGDADVLKRTIGLLASEARQGLPAETLEALEQKSGEKALREALVGFYYHLPNLKADMERMLKVLAIDPHEAKEGPERKYVLDVQKEIRTILYTEIPEVINANTKGKKDPREKLDLLSEMTLRERSGKSQEVVAKLREIEELIEGLPEPLKPARLTLPSRPQAPTGAPAPVVAPLPGPAAPAPLSGAPAAAPAPARAPRRPADLPGHYPRAGKRIELEHIETLMERVLQKISLYNEENPLGRAVQTVLKEHAEDINMAELEQFLRKPNIPTNAEVTVFQQETEAHLRALENQTKRELKDVEAQIAALNNRLSTLRGGPEESARIREEIQELREGLLDNDGNVVTLGRNQLEDRIKNIQHALQLKTGNRRYGNVREVLAMIHIYLRREGIEREVLSPEDIADTMEEEIETERNKKHAIKWYHRLRPNFLKPTLEDTLTHLARKDPIIKKIGVENMEELARAHSDGPRVEAWIENLGDRQYHYEKTVPRLTAYLEFALRDARATYLNSFSQGNARNLIAHLKAARHNYVLHKLSAEVADKSDADKMIAYFQELERHTVDETKITKKFITRHAKWALVKRGAPVLGVGIALPFLGATLAPIVLGTSVVGGGVSLIGKGVGKLGSVMDWKWLKDREKHFYKGAARGAVATAVGLGTAAILPWAWPAALLGGAAAMVPEIVRNRDILWRGTKKTARAAGGAVAGGARLVRPRRRRPPPAAAAA